LRDSQWISFQRLLAASDLVGWSSLEREVFEAESWALCHYLVLSESRRGRSSAAFAQFRSLLDGGSAPLEAARAAFGDEKTLEREVSQYMRAEALPLLSVPVRAFGPPLDSRAVPESEILVELGALSLAIGEQERAERYLERALEQGASSARALAALGDALEARGDADAADLRYQAALAAAPDTAIVQLGFAQLLASRAAATADPAQRAVLLTRAREYFERASLLEPDLAESWSGLAATHLLDGEQPASGLAPVRTARNLLPGDTGIGMLEARIALAAGDSETARREAARTLSRASSRDDLDAARLLLEQIDARAAVR
jgi:tetratricopeptide (TPR) repeat protein